MDLAPMHTVDMLEELLAIARRLGYGIRQDWLGGSGGGGCEIAGQKWIFIDLALTAAEQLDQVAETLRAEPAIGSMRLSAPLQRALGGRRAA
jgi:hypothetical protein